MMHFRNKFLKIKFVGGFTIIETMIAISLFLVVAILGMGAFLNANVIYQKSRDNRSIMDNLSFIMEDMSRNLRTGYSYQCFRKGVDTTLSFATMGVARSCASGWAVAFEAAGGTPATSTQTNYNDQWAYMIDNNGVMWKSSDGAQTLVPLTPTEVKLDTNASSISVLGAEAPTSTGAGDQQQPFVIIRLVGTITYKGTTTPFSLQTSVSQRLLDVAP